VGRDVLIDTDDAAIAKTIVALAETLGLEVIAEGIETAEQRAFLATSGCHYYRGISSVDRCRSKALSDSSIVAAK
jgi:EAL domain-containing protein (putative c-di-GMP-specific phosphodiesterase class I)